MRSVVLSIPKGDYPRFGEDLTAWQQASGTDARWTLGDVDTPMPTTNNASPVTLTCQFDDTFFEQYLEWAKCVTR